MLMHINFQFSSRTLIKLGRTKRKFTAEMLNVALLTRKFVAGQEAGGGRAEKGREGRAGVAISACSTQFMYFLLKTGS